ncbi:hypothetical protein D3C87_1633200 [compost metagenome]
MKLLHCRRGQGVLESLLILPLVFLFFLLLGLLGLRAFLFYYADFQLYEAMICTQHTSRSQCEMQLRSSLQRVLFSPKVETITLRTSSKQVQGKIQIRFASVLGTSLSEMVLEKKLKLPLQE